MHAGLLRLMERLDTEQLVTGIMPQMTGKVVDRALTDAESSSKLRVQRVPWTECIPLSMVTCSPCAIARALSTDERTQWSPAWERYSPIIPNCQTSVLGLRTSGKYSMPASAFSMPCCQCGIRRAWHTQIRSCSMSRRLGL